MAQPPEKPGAGDNPPPLPRGGEPSNPIILHAVGNAHETLNQLDAKLKELQDLSTQVRAKLNDIHDSTKAS